MDLAANEKKWQKFKYVFLFVVSKYSFQSHLEIYDKEKVISLGLSSKISTTEMIFSSLNILCHCLGKHTVYLLAVVVVSKLQTYRYLPKTDENEWKLSFSITLSVYVPFSVFSCIKLLNIAHTVTSCSYVKVCYSLLNIHKWHIDTWFSLPAKICMTI